MAEGDDETKKHLINFLRDFKSLIHEDKIQIIERKITLDTLATLGYTQKDLKNILLALTVEDYYAGPKTDQYKPLDHYWELGVVINDKEYYIKVKIAQTSRDELAVCLSFHKSEWPLTFPYSEK